VLTAYLDDSGTRGDTVSLTVAGFLASVEEWEHLIPEWKGVLASPEFDVCHFHMKDFAHSLREFKDWKGKERKRRRFIRQLLHVLTPRVQFGFAASLILAGYEKANRIYMLEETLGGPYALCGTGAVWLVDQWKEKHGRSQIKVKFIFEDGTTGKGDLINQMEKYGRSSEVGFLPKHEHPAFEAADFAAWEMTWLYRKALHLQPTFDFDYLRQHYRKSYEELRKRISPTTVVMDEKELLKHCALCRVPLRGPGLQQRAMK